jgi:transposase
MESMFQMVLDLPGVRVTEVARTKRGEWVLRVESTLETTACAHCGRTIADVRGHGERVRLRHLPVFDRPVFVELRPKRFVCRSCEGEPVTTQQLDWYDERSRTTRAYAALRIGSHPASTAIGRSSIASRTA